MNEVQGGHDSPSADSPTYKYSYALHVYCVCVCASCNELVTLGGPSSRSNNSPDVLWPLQLQLKPQPNLHKENPSGKATLDDSRASPSCCVALPLGFS